jgi:hypothetical protein
MHLYPKQLAVLNQNIWSSHPVIFPAGLCFYFSSSSVSPNRLRWRNALNVYSRHKCSNLGRVTCFPHRSFAYLFKSLEAHAEIIPASLQILVLDLRFSQRWCPVDCDAKWTCRRVPPFRSNVLSPSLALRMEAVCSLETLVPTYKSTWRHNSDDHYRYLVISSPSYHHLIQQCINYIDERESLNNVRISRSFLCLSEQFAFTTC